MRTHSTSARQRSAHGRLLLALASAGLLFAPTPAAAAPAQQPAASANDDETASDADDDATPTEVATDDDDPTMKEVSRFFREAEQREREGRHVAAADLYIKAYDLLDDPRKYRNSRGATIARIYATLLTAYESASSDAAKTRHACLLRSMLTDYLDDLRAGYGTASDDFPEVHFGRDKLRSVDMTIAAHGDPELICADPENAPQRKRIAMLNPALPGPAGPERVASEPIGQVDDEPYGPIDDGRDDEFAPPRDRKAVAMTAIGGTAIGLGAVSLGVMTGAVIVGAQRTDDISSLTAELQDLIAQVATAEESDTSAAEAMITAKEAELSRLRDEGRVANRVSIATGIVGGAAVLTGAILTALGRKRLRSGTMSMTPNASQTSLGATLRVNF